MEILKLILSWFKKNAVLLLGSLAIFVMFVCFVSGCNYHKNRHPCPEPNIVTNTIILHDSSWYHIIDSLNHIVDSLKNKPQPEPVIVYKPGEKIPVPADIDTAAILAKYYTTFRYYWQFPEKFTPDDSIRIKLNTTISQNKPLVYDLSYQWLKPQTIINTTVDNSVKYNSYLYFGLDIFCPNMEYSEIALFYASRKSLLGIGYAPLSKGGSFKIALPLFTWQ